MFYIHHTSCISPQQTFQHADINKLVESVQKRLPAIEPSYDAIPPGILRRMGKAVRMGVGAAMPLLKNNPMPDGIIIGTTNSGKEDSVKFLSQIIEYDEGLLTPIHFVQSTPNAVAAQIGLLTKNHGYNNTHLQVGLAFEFAMIDAAMMLNENPLNSYLLGAVDDSSVHNYYFEDKGGWYRKQDVSNRTLYPADAKAAGSPGSMAGEGAVMLLVNATESGSIAEVRAVDTLHNDDASIIKEKLQSFIEKFLPAGEKINLLLTGENGDNRLVKYYTSCEAVIQDDVTVARFKHMSGEYPTATAVALWLCCNILQNQFIPDHMIKHRGNQTGFKNVLIYNNYKGYQNSFILVSRK